MSAPTDLDQIQNYTGHIAFLCIVVIGAYLDNCGGDIASQLIVYIVMWCVHLVYESTMCICVQLCSKLRCAVFTLKHWVSFSGIS